MDDLTGPELALRVEPVDGGGSIDGQVPLEHIEAVASPTQGHLAAAVVKVSRESTDAIGRLSPTLVRASPSCDTRHYLCRSFQHDHGGHVHASNSRPTTWRSRTRVSGCSAGSMTRSSRWRGAICSVITLPLFTYRWSRCLGTHIPRRLVVQFDVMASAAIPIYLLGRYLLHSSFLATCLAVAYLLNPALQQTNLEQFHVEAFETPLLALVSTPRSAGGPVCLSSASL